MTQTNRMGLDPMPTPPPRSILFLCTGNSARSQMAEAFARRLAPTGLRIYSAGIEPRGVHPRAEAVMAERGENLSGQWSKDVAAVPVDEVELVVTLCGDAAERCPVFPRAVRRLHWPLADPARATGSDAELMEVFRRVRDEIEARVNELFADWPRRVALDALSDQDLD